MRRRWLPGPGALLLLSAALLLFADEAFARVGGGQSFGGGGGSSGGGYGGGGGGSGGGGALFRLLFWLCLEHPVIGIPLTILIIVVVIKAQSNGGGRRYSSHHPSPAQRAPRRRPMQQADLTALRERDPNFSELLLRDLIQLVFMRAHGERAGGDLGPVAPYLAPQVREALLARGPAHVDEVLIGDLTLQSLRVRGDTATFVAILTANMSEGEDAASARKMFVRERWTWSRRADTLSPGPEAMSRLACVNCGSPIDTTPEGLCQHCGTPIADGRLQWRVEQIELMERRPVRAPELQRGGGVEPGTDMPTVYDPNLSVETRALIGRHPDFSWSDFEQRVREVFLALQEAWASGRWERARPFETDPLFNAHRYQLAQYADAGLSNHGAEVTVRRVTPVKVSRDAYYESITVRIEAKMLDWTTNKDGDVVGGSRTQARVFTEYWTFVRAAGSGGSAKADTQACPSCGAPLDRVDLGGICGYCDTRIVGGEQSWVLSTITQDQSYSG
ncbi:MAG: TIM44-like domain-containing protein [Alphaproteobacteria bacterium]|nr:TIM44-like domain-containing protein [Alphaproteobacteria bacterium]